MVIETIKLWQGMEEPSMTLYAPKNQTSDCAILIFPGGGYTHRAAHEGKGYAQFFAEHGIFSAVVEYRVFPNLFPAPLQDAQRALQILRYNAEKYGFDKNKIAVMGSSAGAHLAALLSTYRSFVAEVGDEISKEEILPNAQILCYGVLTLVGDYTHAGSGMHLLGEQKEKLGASLSPILIADEKTPQAFLWHTWSDASVPMENSLEYAKRLRSKGVAVELHIFPEGNHGMGLCTGEETVRKYNAKWSALLLEWLHFINFN